MHDADHRRVSNIAHLRAALDAKGQPSDMAVRKETCRARRLADGFSIDDRYERALQLRDSGDPRWHQLGNSGQMAAHMYEAQRNSARSQAGR
ncbi:hypothetical protein ACI8AA_06900 [Geodermatophilus sp. SYSU D01180]